MAGIINAVIVNVAVVRGSYRQKHNVKMVAVRAGEPVPRGSDLRIAHQAHRRKSHGPACLKTASVQVFLPIELRNDARALSRGDGICPFGEASGSRAAGAT